MDEITDYLLGLETGRSAAPPDRRATAGDGGEPAPSPPAPIAMGGDRGRAGLVDLLLDRLGDETVRRAIARLIAPR